MDWDGYPINFWSWSGMDLDPTLRGGLELGWKSAPWRPLQSGVTQLPTANMFTSAVIGLRCTLLYFVEKIIWQNPDQQIGLCFLLYIVIMCENSNKITFTGLLQAVNTIPQWYGHRNPSYSEQQSFIALIFVRVTELYKYTFCISCRQHAIRVCTHNGGTGCVYFVLLMVAD